MKDDKDLTDLGRLIPTTGTGKYDTTSDTYAELRFSVARAQPHYDT